MKFLETYFGNIVSRASRFNEQQKLTLPWFLEGTNSDTLRYVNPGIHIREIHRKKPLTRQSNRAVRI